MAQKAEPDRGSHTTHPKRPPWVSGVVGLLVAHYSFNRVLRQCASAPLPSQNEQESEQKEKIRSKVPENRPFLTKVGSKERRSL